MSCAGFPARSSSHPHRSRRRGRRPRHRAATRSTRPLPRRSRGDAPARKSRAPSSRRDGAEPPPSSTSPPRQGGSNCHGYADAQQSAQQPLPMSDVEARSPPPVRRACWITASTNVAVRCDTLPQRSTIIDTPVFAQRTRGVRVSTARNTAISACWIGAAVSPNQKSFVMLTSTSAPATTNFSPCPGRCSQSRSGSPASPCDGKEHGADPRAEIRLAEVERREPGRGPWERHSLRERHEPLFVVAIDELPLRIKQSRRVVRYIVSVDEFVVERAEQEHDAQRVDHRLHPGELEPVRPAAPSARPSPAR